MRKEINSSIKNIWFCLPLAFFSTIALIHCYLKISDYNALLSSLTDADKSEGNCCFPVYTSFNLWIGNDNSIYSKILFYIAPFLSALPYSWSYCRDLKKGIISNKSKSKKQYHSKLIGVFVSSGLLIAIPLFINFIGISLFVPSVKPDSAYDIYYIAFSNNFIGQLFYNVPYIYVLFYIVLNFSIYGLLGCIGLSFSTFFDSRYMAVFLPIMFLVSVEAIKIVFSSFIKSEISMLSFMYPYEPQFDNGFIIFSEIAILIFIVLVFSKIGVKNKKNED